MAIRVRRRVFYSFSALILNEKRTYRKINVTYHVTIFCNVILESLTLNLLFHAASCTISGPKINTFDDVSDFMPLSQCYHVMVKDATDDNLFAVLVANAAKNSLAKVRFFHSEKQNKRISSIA